MSNILKGIDVSKYQANIDWDKVKSSIDFAILRCGFGSDIAKQDDTFFARNVSECERLNIPFAVYLYSYAKTEQQIDSEIAHTLRLLGSHKPFCVYFDMEDNSTANLGKAKLTAFAKRFCEGVKAKGFKVGVYANQNWFTNYLDVAALHNLGYSIWCAKYSDNKPNIAAPYDIWQYSSKGSVNGIKGNVDMNYMYKDIRNVFVAAKRTVEDVARDVMAGKYGIGHDVRRPLIEAEGFNYEEVRTMVNKLMGEKDAPKVNYYPKYNGTTVSIVTALNSLGVNSSFDNRKKIAKVNGIISYSGTAAQNTKMLNLLKQGKLIKY